jgi:hypothetical protein
MGQSYNFLIDNYDVVEYMHSIHAANTTSPNSHHCFVVHKIAKDSF